MSDNTHAAMCVYCGETIIYDTREVTDMAAAQAQLIEHDQQCAKNPLVSDLARHKRMFAAACEQLGNIQQALGSTVVGIEPALVRELVEERDALAAHVEQLTNIAEKVCTIAPEYLDHLGADAAFVIKSSPATSLARLIAESRIEGALAVRHLTQGDDWEDTELRAVIDDYVAGLRRQTEGDQ